jgi:hypothetical protein
MMIYEIGAPVKRGLSAYMFFINENRNLIKEENPALSFGEVCSKLAKTWLKMTVEERKPYEELAMNDKKRYHKEMEQWYNSEKGQTAIAATSANQVKDVEEEETSE